MSSMSDYLEDQLIDHIFRTNSFTKPTVLAVALCTAAPSDSDTGNLAGIEVANAGSYARQTLNPLDANWDASSGGNGTTSNLSIIAFPMATMDWGVVTHVAILDSATWGAGNLLFHGALAATKNITSGDTFQFNVNQLAVQLDD